MPLTIMKAGETLPIARIGGADAVRRRLSELGFVVGASVTVVSRPRGGLIAKVGESRVALDSVLASHVFA